MKKAVLIFGMLFLVSCGGGSSGSSSGGTDTTPSAVITNTADSLKIVGNNQTQTFNKTTSATINIVGNSNVIVIKSNVSELEIIGNDNMLDITAGVSITSCKITGNNNILTKLTNQSVNCKVSGTGNKDFN